MFYLSPLTAGQEVVLTLRESRYFLDDTFTDYLMELKREETGEQLFLIPVVALEVERYTSLTIGTDAALPLVGKALIPNSQAGNYYYTIYGQNSTTNLDPENASVVGIVERGRCVVRSTTEFFNSYAPVIPADKSYGG